MLLSLLPWSTFTNFRIFIIEWIGSPSRLQMQIQWNHVFLAQHRSGELFSKSAGNISVPQVGTIAAVAKHIEFPLIADAREWSRMGSCGTFMEDATSEVTGKANELRRSRFVIHRFCAYHHIRPPPVLKVGILLASLKNNTVISIIHSDLTSVFENNTNSA